MQKQFVLKVALATTDIDRLVEIGSVDFNGFVREFRNFDWSNEITREFWSRKSTPAMGVTNLSNEATIWVGAYDWLRLLNPFGGPTQEPALSFYVGLNNGPPPPDIYRRKEDRDFQNCEFRAETLISVEKLFEFFFYEQYGELYRELYKLEIY